MDRRVGIHRPNDNLQLAVDAGLLACILCRQRECPDTFAVQSHVFREGLGQRNLVSLGNKMTDCKCIPGRRPRSKTLVGHIKEGEKLPFFDNIRDQGPLLWRRVNTRWIVRTRMQENNSVLRRGLSAFDHHESP